MSVNPRGKYWVSDPERETLAIAKRVRRRTKRMRDAVAQGTHVRVVTSGTPGDPGHTRLVPVSK